MPGTHAPNGTKIDIVVARTPRAVDAPPTNEASRRPDDTLVVVPNVVGRSPADAEKILKMAGLASRRKTSEGKVGRMFIVVSQAPAPGLRVPKGSIVTISTGYK